MADQYIAIGGSSYGDAWGFRLVRWDGVNFTCIAARYPDQDGTVGNWSPTARDITTTATIAVTLDAIWGEYGFYLERWEGGVYIGSKETFLNETCWDCAFSPNGKYIAVTHEDSPYFTLLQWDGTNLTVAATFTLPEQGAGVNWSPDGQYIGVACYKYKHLFLLKWDEVNLTKVAEAALPCGTYGRVFDCAFSPNGQYIGVAFRSYAPDKAAGFFLLRWDEVNLTKVAEYAIQPGEETECFTCRFSPNGQYIAVGHARNSSFTLLKWDGVNLTVAAKYPFVHDEWVLGVCFNETGTLIGIATDETPYFLLLHWDGVSLTFINSYNPDGKSVGSCSFPLPPSKTVSIPDTLLCEQTKNPINVGDPKPEFSAIHRVKEV